MKAKDESKFVEFTDMIGSAAIPSKSRATMQYNLTLANIEVNAYKLYGIATYVTAAAALAGAIMLSIQFVGTTSFASTFVVAIVLLPFLFVAAIALMRWLMQYVIDSRIMSRVSAMEDELPDYLTEVSLNLKSGQSLPDSLANAAKEDFGEISAAMANVTTRVNLGYDLEDTINTYLRSYPSDTLEESFELILISWRKGTSTPRIIDRIVSNMKIMRNLREKINASVANYRIFLGTITLMVAPAMMAVSYYVINLIRQITTQVMQYTQDSTLPFSINAVQFTDRDFIWFSCLTVAVISSFTALTTQYIQKGTVRGANKQLAIYLTLSLGSYALFYTLFGIFFKLINVG